MSWFCVSIAKNPVKDLDAFMLDTPHILCILDDMNENEFLPKSAKPISIDLKSMYTNIPLDEGLEAFRITIEKRTLNFP